MGNSGSVHNLHNDGVNNEISSYYTQQYLKRSSGEAKKNNYHPQLQNAPAAYNDVVLGGSSTDRLITAFKVLPQPTESLKLRATTNGAILHAGGTISCRVKDSLDDRPGSSALVRDDDPTFYPMRRSHTLILDGHGETVSERKSAPPLTEFRRSQTLLHVGYNRTKSQECSSPKLDDRKTRLPHTTPNGTGTTLKKNKYNKKRKAPPAPAKTTSDGNNTISANATASEAKAACLAKPRIYTTNSNKTGSSAQLQQPRLRQPSYSPFQRGAHVRNSANNQVQAQSKEYYVAKLPYRREKSFDAVLLRQKENNECFERSPVQRIKITNERENEREQHSKTAHKSYEQTTDSNRGKKLTRKATKNTPNKTSSTGKVVESSEHIYPMISQREDNRGRMSQEKLLASELRASNAKQDNGTIQKKENVAPGTEKKTKVQQSRIPQLKRTFYFGMELTKDMVAAAAATKSNCNAQEFRSVHGMPKDDRVADGEDDLNLHRHNLDAAEEIEDNGILVHVRPTLPRRQPETPSFSPAAAWRNLLEEQQRLQHERSKMKLSTLGNKFVESPICLISTTKDNRTTTSPVTWTPEQDLEDEDEEEADEKNKPTELNVCPKTETSPEKRSLHIFSLSLPRDVHLQGQFKTSLDCAEGSAPGLKTANCWLVPGFNSLQKFKTTLSGGVGSRLNSKCSCPKGLIKRSNSNQPNHVFQTIFGETFATDSCNHVPDCDLYKSLQSTPSSHNDNWVLHKSKINENSVQSTDKSFSAPFEAANRNSLVYIQPKSLTHVCGGKHIMYLPGQEACNMFNKEPHIAQHKTSTSTFKRQRQRQEMARESLQDLTPVQDIQKSNARLPEKNTHRFSFQSTVRVLEKRRIAEKLSKDAEIQEAQRLNELEAMKRVEEDFQRKRAQEKANIRNQLRLHLNSNLDNEDYRSLPLNINDRYENHQQQSDTNNNIFCRAEPDGAVSPSPIFNDNPDKLQHNNFPLSSTKATEMRRFDSDCEESEIETQLADFQRTALLIEPYLQSII